MGTWWPVIGTLFITRTLARKAGDKRYYTHRLIWSEPEKGKMRRRSINLGVHYPFPKDQWRTLCLIIRRLLDKQEQLEFDFDSDDDPALVIEAHNLLRRMIEKGEQNVAKHEDKAI